MSITIGTFIFLIITVFIFVKNSSSLKKLFISLFNLLVITSLFMNVGYFIKIGSFSLQYNEFILFVTFFISLLLVISKKFDTAILLKFILMTIVFCIPLVLNLVLNYQEYGISYDYTWDNYFLGRVDFTLLKPNSRSLLHLLRIVIFFFVIGCYLRFSNKNDFDSLIKKIYKISIIYLFILLIEFIFKNVLYSPIVNDFYLSVLGKSESTYYGLGLMRNGIYSIIGLFREQSHLCNALMVLSVIFLFVYEDNKIKKYLFLSLVLIAVPLCTMAFSSILGIAIYYLFLFLINIRKSGKNQMLCILSLFIVIIAAILVYSFSSYSERILNSLDVIFNFDINGKYDFESENVRLFSIMYNLNIFSRHPLFGIGLGTSYSHGGVACILTSIGLIGFTVYSLYYKCIFRKNNYKKGVFLPFIVILFYSFLVGDISDLYSIPYFIIVLSCCYRKSEIFYKKD